MASGEETKEKEKPISQYSHEVSMLFCKFKGKVDNKLFRISVATSADLNRLEQIVDGMVRLNQGLTVFYKPVNKDKYIVYASYLSEEEIIRILELKAFW